MCAAISRSWHYLRYIIDWIFKGNNGGNGWTEEVEECQQRSRKEELQKTEEQTDKNNKRGQKNEYLESICDEIMELQRTGRYDLMCRFLNNLNRQCLMQV